MAKSGKGRAHLSREDRDIWGKITKTATPLATQHRNYANVFEELLHSHVPQFSKPVPQSVKKLQSSAAAIYHPPVHQKPKDAQQWIDKKTSRNISKGKITIDGRLDLHGFTQQQAHNMLYDYIENAYYVGKRTILVITGKGNLGRGVLRENVPKWLGDHAFRHLVSGYTNSNSSHGGEGALYVRIKKKPRP